MLFQVSILSVRGGDGSSASRRRHNTLTFGVAGEDLELARSRTRLNRLSGGAELERGRRAGQGGLTSAEYDRARNGVSGLASLERSGMSGLASLDR